MKTKAEVLNDLGNNFEAYRTADTLIENCNYWYQVARVGIDLKDEAHRKIFMDDMIMMKGLVVGLYVAADPKTRDRVEAAVLEAMATINDKKVVPISEAHKVNQ